MDILQLIQSKRNSLSVSEQKVCDAILDKPSLVENSTITMLAELSLTSVSAVQRFCQSLGYQGYKDFRYDMIRQQQAIEEATAVADSVQQIATSFSASISALGELDRFLLDELASQVLAADRVYTLGLYRSFLAAEKLRMNLEDMGIVAFSGGDSISFGHLCYTMTAHSTLILFSVSGSPVNFRGLFDSLAQVPQNIWLVTFNPNAKLRKQIPHVIVLPTPSYSRQYPLDEHAIFLAFIEILSHHIRNRFQHPLSDGGTTK